MTIDPERSTGHESPSERVQPLVRDGAATLDLRERPTREELGIAPGEQAIAYERDLDTDGIHTRVVLPDSAEVELLAFGIAVSTLNPVGRVEDAPTDPPARTVVNVRFDSYADAVRQLNEQADSLGLDRSRIATLTGEVAGAPLPAPGVLRGLRQDWLSIEVELRGGNGDLTANYLFNYGLPSAEELLERARRPR